MEIWISSEQTQHPLTPAQEETISRVAREALKRAAPQLGDAVEVSVSLVDNETIQELNREHRGLDKPTDVLSFAQLEGEELAPPPDGTDVMLGDIVISIDRCREQALDYGHSFERELGFLVAHGMLHLLGFDHQTSDDEAAMMAKTEEILAELGLKR